MKWFFGSIVAILIIFFIIFIGRPLYAFILISNYDPNVAANTTYLENLKSYESQADKPSTIDDVLERLTVIDDYFNEGSGNSASSDTLTNISYDHIQTLFGEPDQTIPAEAKSYEDAVYRYFYDNQALTFYQDYSSIDQYVFENFLGNSYEESELDELFFELVQFAHQSDKSQTSILLDEYPAIIDNKQPSRLIQQNGWAYTNYRNKLLHYFDGEGALTAPEDYLVIHFWILSGNTQIRTIDRRYAQVIENLDQDDENANKIEETLKHIKLQLSNESNRTDDEEFNEFLDDLDMAQDYSESDTIQLGLLVESFGPIAYLHYSYKLSNIEVSWAYHDGNALNKITAKVSLDAEVDLRELEDLYELSVSQIESSLLNDSNAMIYNGAYKTNQ